MKLTTSFILVLTFVIGGYYFWQRDARYDGVACTMEALICPDGSGVGRSGPNCEFNSCPNQTFFTGELIEQGGEYRLVIPAPEGIGHEVTYTMPVEFSRISYTIATFLDKYVKISGTFTIGNTLKVETIEEMSFEEMSQGSLRVGETKFINGVKVTLNNIVEDSRCPVDVTCIQIGRVVANVSLRSDTDTETLNLASDRSTHFLFDIYKISIARVEPTLKYSTVEHLETDYRLTFKVER